VRVSFAVILVSLLLVHTLLTTGRGSAPTGRAVVAGHAGTDHVDVGVGLGRLVDEANHLYESARLPFTEAFMRCPCLGRRVCR
jgi:hypothetical protein